MLRLPHGRRLLGLVALLAALVVVVGCGEQTATPSAGTGPDPATLAPADAFVYGEVVVRPEGAMRDDVAAAARAVSRVEDPGAELVRLLDRGFRESDQDLTYERDFEPWLGERASGFARFGASKDPEWALYLTVEDRDAAEQADERFRANRVQQRAGRYRGIAYDRDVEDRSIYTALVGDFYVSGSLAGLRAAIDASRGESLADTARFEDAIADVDEDALASLWFDPQQLARQLRDADGVEPELRRVFGSDRFAQAEPITASLTADADAIVLEAVADSQLTGASDDADAGPQVDVEQLPGDAWLALASPPIGPLLREALDGAGVHDMAAAQLRRGVGLDLDRDLLDVMGGLGLFVRGTSPLDIGGGALLRTTSDAGARRLVTVIESLVASAGLGQTRPLTAAGARGFELRIEGAPQPVVVLAEGDRVAAGYATSSARDLLEPQERFGDSGDGRAAIDSLGEGFEPSFVLLAPPLVELLRALDALEVADFGPALPYLSAYRSLAVGSKDDGDRTTVRVVAALR
jgi:Protein of unknown function (DUF3352)